MTKKEETKIKRKEEKRKEGVLEGGAEGKIGKKGRKLTTKVTKFTKR